LLKREARHSGERLPWTDPGMEKENFSRHGGKCRNLLVVCCCVGGDKIRRETLAKEETKGGAKKTSLKLVRNLRKKGLKKATLANNNVWNANRMRDQTKKGFQWGEASRKSKLGV